MHHTIAALHKAMGRMGNVIFSAALIMAGTIGTMTSSGVTSLVEIGLSVIIGLLLFIPSAATVIDRGHFWPFVRQSKSRPTKEAEEVSNAPALHV